MAKSIQDDPFFGSKSSGNSDDFFFRNESSGNSEESTPTIKQPYINLTQFLPYLLKLTFPLKRTNPALNSFLLKTIKTNDKSLIIAQLNELYQEDNLALKHLFLYLINPPFLTQHSPEPSSIDAQDQEDYSHSYDSFLWILLNLFDDPAKELDLPRNTLETHIEQLENSNDEAFLFFSQHPNYLNSAPPYLLSRLFHSEPGLPYTSIKQYLSQEKMQELLDECLYDAQIARDEFDAVALHYPDHTFLHLLEKSPSLVNHIKATTLSQLLNQPAISNQNTLITQANPEWIGKLTQELKSCENAITNFIDTALTSNPHLRLCADTTFIQRWLFLPHTQTVDSLFYTLTPEQQQRVMHQLSTRVGSLQGPQLALFRNNSSLITSIIANNILTYIVSISCSDSLQKACITDLVIPTQSCIFQTVDLDSLNKFIRILTPQQLNAISISLLPYFKENPHQLFNNLSQPQSQVIIDAIVPTLRSQLDFSNFNKLCPEKIKLPLLKAYIQSNAKTLSQQLSRASFNEIMLFFNALTDEQKKLIIPFILPCITSVDDLLILLETLSYEQKQILLSLIEINTPSNFLPGDTPSIFQQASLEKIVDVQKKCQYNNAEEILLPFLIQGLQTLEDVRIFRLTSNCRESIFTQLLEKLPSFISEASLEVIDDFLSALTPKELQQVRGFLMTSISNTQIKTSEHFKTIMSYLNPKQRNEFGNRLLEHLPTLFDSKQPFTSVENLIYYSSKEQISSILERLKHEIQHHIQNRTLKQIIQDATTVIPKLRHEEHAALYQSALNFRSTIRSTRFKEVTLGLSLSGEIQEGNSSEAGLSDTKNRFKRILSKIKQLPIISKELPDLHFVMHNDRSLSQELKTLKSHGALQGIYAEWKDHGFAFYLLRDHDKIHVIYVNRGRQHERAEGDVSTPMVFTLDASAANTASLIENLIFVLNTENRESISQFLNQNLYPHLKREISKSIVKSMQKVGNCAIASANIAWHFELTSRQMQQNPNLTFVEAYQRTKEAYKDMRMEDRADLFCEMIVNWQNFVIDKFNEKNRFTQVELIEPEIYQNNLNQIIEKMVKKDIAKPDKKRVLFLLQRFKENHPELLLPLFKTITHEPEPSLLDAKLKWAKTLLDIVGNTVDAETKSEMSKTIEQLQLSNDLYSPPRC